MASRTKAHHAAEFFPLMDSGALADLAADIQRYGQQEPIKMFDGQILDGRSRMAACKQLGIEPKIENVELPENTTPEDYSFSLNLHRRHLTPSQSAAAVIMRRKETPRSEEETGREREILAEMLNGLAGERTIAKAQELDKLDPSGTLVRKVIDDPEFDVGKALAEAKSSGATPKSEVQLAVDYAISQSRAAVRIRSEVKTKEEAAVEAIRAALALGVDAKTIRDASKLEAAAWAPLYKKARESA